MKSNDGYSLRVCIFILPCISPYSQFLLPLDSKIRIEHRERENKKEEFCVTVVACRCIKKYAIWRRKGGSNKINEREKGLNECMNENSSLSAYTSTKYRSTLSRPRQVNVVSVQHLYSNNQGR